MCNLINTRDRRDVENGEDLSGGRKILKTCMVITYSRLWINRIRLPILLVVSWTEKINISLSPFAPENLVSRDGFGRPVPRQPEPGAYSRDSSRFSRQRPLIYLNRKPQLGQAQVYRVTQLRTNGVECRESAGTGPVVLKIVPVTGAAFLQVIMDQLTCACFYPHPLQVLVWSGHI